MSKKPSRPPGQYVMSAGTQYCLVANEYDKNTYAQCPYIAHRTRVRCKQIRPKEELAKNNGICEQHEQLQSFLKQNHTKEKLRVRSECDNLQSKRKKFKMLIVSNENVSDEDEWLQPATTMGDEIPDQLYDNPLDEEPLRNAEVFTEKDILRMKMGLVRKDIEDFQLHRDYLEAHASRLCEKIGESGKTVTVDVSHLRTYDASLHYGSKDYLKYTENEPVSRKCLFGRNPADSVVIIDVVESMLDKVEGVERKQILHVCNQPALEMADYCFDHILMDEKQQLFGNCTVCGDIALSTNDPTCTKHLKEMVKMRSNHSIYGIRKGEEDIGNEYTLGSYTVPTKQINIDSEDEEDVRLANLSSIEMMPSPMQPVLSSGFRRANILPSPASSLSRRNSLVPGLNLKDAKDRLTGSRGVGDDLLSLIDPKPIVSPSEEYGCAREREFCRANFNAPIKEEKSDIAKKPVPRNPTPRILPSSRSNFGAPLTLTGQSKNPYTLQKPVPQKYAGAHPISATKFPLASLPKTIPLERTQEPTRESAEMELVEDRRTPPPKYPGRDEVPRRVPYVTKPTQTRAKGDSRLNSLPHQPSAARNPQYPVKSAMPLPPHRAIAMGMKPSEMTLPSTPRPSFTPNPKPYQYPTPPTKPYPNKFVPANPDSNFAGRKATAPRLEQPHMVPASFLTSPVRNRGYTVKSTTGKYSAMDMSKLVNDSNYKNLTVKNFLKMGMQSSDVEHRIQIISEQISSNQPQNEPVVSEQQTAFDALRQHQYHKQPVEIPLERVSQDRQTAPISRPAVNRPTLNWTRETQDLPVVAQMVPTTSSVPSSSASSLESSFQTSNVVPTTSVFPVPVQQPKSVHVPDNPQPLHNSRSLEPSSSSSASIPTSVQPLETSRATHISLPTVTLIPTTELISIPIPTVEHRDEAVEKVQKEKEPVRENTSETTVVVKEEEKTIMKSVAPPLSTASTARSSPRKAPVPQPLMKSYKQLQMEGEKTEEISRKRKNDEPSSSAPPKKRHDSHEKPYVENLATQSTKKPAVPSPPPTVSIPSARTPRAAAIVANQALTSKTPAKEELSSRMVSMDPLSMLAAVSEIELQKERNEKSSSVEISPTSLKASSSTSRPSSSKKSNTPSKAPPAVRRRSSRAKGKETDGQDA